jgi:hypothetical protein
LKTDTELSATAIFSRSLAGFAISKKRSLEPGHELAAKDAAEHLDRQQETRARGVPARAIRR